MRLGIALFGAGVLGTALLLSSNDARACGGCFPPQPPPGEQQSVVTDHRMILTLSKTQSTLYDQIQYSGNPSEFAWVLPIAGTVDVGLSADTLFTTLHNISAVAVQEPPRNCPAAPVCNYYDSDERAAPSAGGSNFADAGAANPVEVLKKEVVGPYETVQLKSEDPSALNTWLTQNGFNIPEDIKPVINQYVTEKFNFLALKLKPGQGVSSMRPVRVTTQGAAAVLPLRMVAAGTGANVGVTLWVIGEGRYEPQNFPSFVIKNEELTWDWTTGSSDYKELRAQRSSAQPGKTWEVETSESINRTQIQTFVRQAGNFNQQVPDYLPIKDAQGKELKSASQVREEDLETLFEGIANGQERLTRMRSDLSRPALAVDLLMTASADQGQLDNVRIPKLEKGQPLCPIYDGNCRQVGTAPRDQAQAQAQNNWGQGDETFTCKMSRTGAGSTALLGMGVFVGLAFVRTMRDRRRQGRR
jgi:hypothetical protein